MKSEQSAGLQRRKTPSSLPAGCLTLFGLPFAAAGIFTLVQGLRKSSEGFSKDALIMVMAGLLFAGVGTGIIVFSLYARKSMKATAALRQAHPAEPWLWREDWSTRAIRSNQRTNAFFMLFFALAWNGISWTVAMAFFLDRKQQPAGVAWLVWLFPAIGVVLAYAAITKLLTWRRFGTATFRISALPARTGGVLQGFVEVPSHLPAEIPVHLRLSCVRRETERRGDDHRTTEHTLWQDEKFLRGPFPELSQSQTTIPVYFRLPADQPSTGEITSGKEILWKLEALAALPGPNLALDFGVPVFSGGETPEPEPPEDPTIRYRVPAAELRESIKSKILVQDGVEGRELVFPALRNPGAAVFGGLFFAGWTGVVYALLKSSAPVVFPIVFGLFDVLIGYFWFHTTFHRSCLTANRQRLVSRQSWLFIQSVKEWPASSIRNISLKVGMSSGQQCYHDLIANLESGKSATLASAIPSKIEADWLVAELKSSLGLRTDTP
jgi:hypothetical protein